MSSGERMLPARGGAWNLDICKVRTAQEHSRGGGVAPATEGDGTMAIRQKHKVGWTIDAAAWLLGTAMVVLAVLDVLVWAPLWNVPNPASRLLLPAALQSALPAQAPADTPFGAAQASPAALRKASLMRSCQPGPPSWNVSSTSLSRRSDTISLTPGNAG